MIHLVSTFLTFNQISYPRKMSHQPYLLGPKRKFTSQEVKNHPNRYSSYLPEATQGYRGTPVISQNMFHELPSQFKKSAACVSKLHPSSERNSRSSKTVFDFELKNYYIQLSNNHPFLDLPLHLRTLFSHVRYSGRDSNYSQWSTMHYHRSWNGYSQITG